MMDEQIMRSLAASRRYLDVDSRREIIRFVKSRWNQDGGVRGRDDSSDLYYTFFATLCMTALRGPVPWFRLHRFLRPYGDGESLDLAHLVCLIRLRLIFPASGRVRTRFAAILDARASKTPYDLFLKAIAAPLTREGGGPAETVPASASQTTPNLAAAILVNDRPDPVAEALLLERFLDSGGCAATASPRQADLLSTATALVALSHLKTDLSPVRDACFDYIESLWRDSGGFSGTAADPFEDVEYTFYALLSIGSLMSSAGT